MISSVHVSRNHRKDHFRRYCDSRRVLTNSVALDGDPKTAVLANHSDTMPFLTLD